MEQRTRLEELWFLVDSIPPGFCASYGSLGRQLSQPVSGLLIGKWMFSCPPSHPWWRVVAADGTLKVGKRDPALAAHQLFLLTQEGVTFSDGAVNMTVHRFEFT